MRLADLTSADLAEADRAPLPAIPLGATEQHGPRLRSGGVKAVSANGILGDPTTADAAEGARILDRWTGALIAAVAEHFPEPR
ncbi:hypothetical protein [Nocardia africana]|uniref:Creatinine amidohydrolase family protein, mycofactocin system n=1 Tax=Nocardia africana TaxID=134964 RepID=A0A378X0C6_9NOCA|nr:creatinine amidohydrolase family protein, mycofactocin system [Nocardia africana]